MFTADIAGRKPSQTENEETESTPLHDLVGRAHACKGVEAPSDRRPIALSTVRLTVCDRLAKPARREREKVADGNTTC